MKIVVLYQSIETIKKFYGPRYVDMEETKEDEETVGGLKEAGHEAVALNIDQVFSLPECDVVFNICDEFEDPRAIKIPKILENLGIKYTGASSESFRLSANKKIIKKILTDNKISTPNYFIAELGTKKLAIALKKHKMKYPLIVKPAHQDGSFAIELDSVVHNYEALIKKVMEVYAESKNDVLIEEFIDGREFSIGLVGNEKPIFLPAYELIFKNFENKPKVITYEAKWVMEHEDYKNTMPECPAKISSQLLGKIRKIALKCYKVFKCTGYARVDFRMDAKGKLYVLELNTNPSLLKSSEFVYSAQVYGWSFSQLLDQIVKFAAEREQEKK